METYSISIDFSGIYPNPDQLQSEISSNVNIITNLIYSYTSQDDDSVKLYFNTPLSAPEKLELDNIVAAHVPVYIPSTPYSLDIIPRNNDFNKSSYKRLTANVFPKTTYATAKCVSHMDNALTSYTILIFDKNNRQILAEATFTNTTEGIQNIGVLANLPSDTTQIEISGKVTGNGKAYLENLTINYN